MKRKVLKSSLFIFSLVTLTTIGVNATENSTVTSSTNEAKTEFKVEATEDTNSSESEEPLQPKTVFTPEEEEMKENKETVSYKRNINLKYLISPGPLVTNPNYCSKLVFNAYWYGSGNSPVVKDYYAHVQYIYPSALPDIFNKSYAPRKIGDY